MANNNPRDFKNPSGYWKHEGGYVVELTDEADKSIAPSQSIVTGNKVTVTNGKVHQQMGGIQFHANGSPFYWGYSFIKVIKDLSGNLIWVNRNYR